MNKIDNIVTKLLFCVGIVGSVHADTGYTFHEAQSSSPAIHWNVSQSADPKACPFTQTPYRVYELSVTNNSDKTIYVDPASYFRNGFNAVITRQALQEDVLAAWQEYVTRKSGAWRPFKTNLKVLGLGVGLAILSLVVGYNVYRYKHRKRVYRVSELDEKSDEEYDCSKDENIASAPESFRARIHEFLCDSAPFGRSDNSNLTANVSVICAIACALLPIISIIVTLPIGCFKRLIMSSFPSDIKPLVDKAVYVVQTKPTLTDPSGNTAVLGGNKGEKQEESQEVKRSLLSRLFGRKKGKQTSESEVKTEQATFEMVDRYIEIPPHHRLTDQLLVDERMLTFASFQKLFYAKKPTIKVSMARLEK